MPIPGVTYGPMVMCLCRKSWHRPYQRLLGLILDTLKGCLGGDDVRYINQDMSVLHSVMKADHKWRQHHFKAELLQSCAKPSICKIVKDNMLQQVVENIAGNLFTIFKHKNWPRYWYFAAGSKKMFYNFIKFTGRPGRVTLFQPFQYQLKTVPCPVYI